MDSDLITDLIEMIIQRIDMANLTGDQIMMLESIDIARVVFERINENYYELRAPLIPKTTDDKTKETLIDEMRDQLKSQGALSATRPSLVALLRKLLLRLQPYLAPSTKPLSLPTKILTLLHLLAPFLSGLPLPKERGMAPFSTGDDPDNVSVPCTLSLVLHEIYPNILAILRSSTAVF